MSKKQNVKEFIYKLGLSNFGIIECREFKELVPYFEERKEKGLFNEFEEQDINKKINPHIYMKEGKSIISIAFPYLHCKNNKDNGFSLYTKGTDYHKVLKLYLDKICNYINEIGGKAISLVDSNFLPERYIAYLAGVGFIGKNNMIITEKYGSYVFLGEIITDLDIFDDDIRSLNEIGLYRECGECINCYKACPTKSINKSRKNSNICTSYLTQKKDLDNKEIKLLGGRIFGCDTCQVVCPYNENIHFSQIEEFKPFDFMISDNTEEILQLSNKSFKESYLKTSCGWRGKNVLKRNALLRVYEKDKERIKNLKTDSDYIKGYIERL